MLSKSEQFNALVWECNRMGMTYGRLTTTYTKDQLRGVYLRYEEVLRERSAAIQSRERQMKTYEEEYI